MTGKELIAKLQALSEHDLSKEVQTFDIDAGNYGDSPVQDLFMEPTSGAVIVLGMSLKAFQVDYQQLGYDHATCSGDPLIEYPDNDEYMRGFREGLLKKQAWANQELDGFDRDFSWVKNHD